MLSDGCFNNEAIKYTMSEDIVDVLSDFLNIEENENMDYQYIGKIVDNKDPEKLGRCKIRILGVFGDTIQDKDLPWALPDPSFIGSLKGSFIVPPEGCTVSVYFERGERYLPRYTRKVIDKNNLPKNKNKNYPDNMIFFETDDGDRFEINRKKKTMLFEHSSGTKIVIERNGDTVVERKDGSKVELEGGNINIEANSKVVINPGPLGSISLGKGATIPCPDLSSCLVTGGALAVGTLIPGQQVLLK